MIFYLDKAIIAKKLDHLKVYTEYYPNIWSSSLIPSVLIFVYWTYWLMWNALNIFLVVFQLFPPSSGLVYSIE